MEVQDDKCFFNENSGDEHLDTMRICRSHVSAGNSGGTRSDFAL